MKALANFLLQFKKSKIIGQNNRCDLLKANNILLPEVSGVCDYDYTDSNMRCWKSGSA